MSKHRQKKRSEEQVYTTAQSQYNPAWAEEYKMMREELMVYMEKLQSLRDITYGAVGAVLVAVLATDIHFFFILLPICFILPSYICAVNYWTCVRKASAYLVVFHESYEDCPFHWESRHNMWKKAGKHITENFRESVLVSIGPQLASYYICFGAVIISYLFKMYLRALEVVAQKTVGSAELKFSGVNEFLYTEIDGFTVWIYLFIAFAVSAVSVYCFWKFLRSTSYEKFLTDFTVIRLKEQQSDIGKCWPEGLPESSENSRIYEDVQNRIKRRL